MELAVSGIVAVADGDVMIAVVVQLAGAVDNVGVPDDGVLQFPFAIVAGGAGKLGSWC